ncbi:MAG: hypothetical protein LBQ05_00590 [Christensenellaceae bacterium]|jgi:hypothetical protein|nr:hypothetical protein [Christensenellaceae bacterium]
MKKYNVDEMSTKELNNFIAKYLFGDEKIEKEFGECPNFIINYGCVIEEIFARWEKWDLSTQLKYIPEIGMYKFNIEYPAQGHLLSEKAKTAGDAVCRCAAKFVKGHIRHDCWVEEVAE